MVVVLPFLVLVREDEWVCEVVELVDREERGRSKEEDGVAVSEKVSDFRRAGGKKPRVRRGRRAISVGVVSLGRMTQESCFQGDSESAWDDVVQEEGRGEDVPWLVEYCQPFERVDIGVGVLSFSAEPLP